MEHKRGATLAPILDGTVKVIGLPMSEPGGLSLHEIRPHGEIRFGE